MRWAFFLPLVLLTLVIQTTLNRFIAVHLSVGTLVPDLAAVVAVFAVVRLRGLVDALLAAWVLGFAVDLASAGGFGAGAVGPMAVAYTLAAWSLFSTGGAFLRDRALPQILLTGVFCLISQIVYVTLQAMLNWGEVGWGLFGQTLLQACLIAVYTACVAPLVHWPLRRVDRLLIAAPSGRRSGR